MKPFHRPPKIFSLDSPALERVLFFQPLTFWNIPPHTHGLNIPQIFFAPTCNQKCIQGADGNSSHGQI